GGTSPAAEEPSGTNLHAARELRRLTSSGRDRGRGRRHAIAGRGGEGKRHADLRVPIRVGGDLRERRWPEIRLPLAEPRRVARRVREKLDLESAVWLRIQRPDHVGRSAA